ncbi:MAG: DUF983 domain-containing protein [Hyphomicrobiaceae bacterium]|nr:DUF983 domain-containing protein [Hyphomicrobiaceae bacterium]MCC0023029.1 DUF983 domain-containing protein [Hyphomicrobiaceae bacterium]
MSHDHTPDHETPNPFATGIAGRCPRCGEGLLFTGFLKTASKCESCGLDLEFADSGDGPAIFIMFIVGFVVITLALLVNVVFNPPMWVHLLLWIPTTIILSLALLRPFKGIMIALQYRNDAREGQQTDDHA